MLFTSHYITCGAVISVICLFVVFPIWNTVVVKIIVNLIYFHPFCRPGDEGYGSRQNEGYQGNYPYKDDGPPRRDYDRVESGERNAPRITGFLPFLLLCNRGREQ